MLSSCQYLALSPYASCSFTFLFTPYLFMHDWWQGFTYPHEKKLYQSVIFVYLHVCLFICLPLTSYLETDHSYLGCFTVISRFMFVCLCVCVWAEVPTASPLLSCSDLHVISLQERRCETCQWENNEQLMSNCCYILDLQCFICPSDYSQTPSECALQKLFPLEYKIFFSQ